MNKTVVCGAGFLGSNIAKALASSTSITRHVQISSRHPDRMHEKIKAALLPGNQRSRLLPPVPADITRPDSLAPAFKDASTVVSLVGILNGKPEQFERIQWRGAENVARAAKEAGAKLIHFSAIGADPKSDIPYNRTKGLGEEAVLKACPDATIIRPSLVFGPEDDFFNRFNHLASFLPFLPVFGGGTTRFQPVFVGDIAVAVEIICRQNPDIEKSIKGRIVEAGGPDVFTYKELMQLVLRYSGRQRFILSMPFFMGMAQGAFMEMLPQNTLTVTRSQVKQLKMDNIVDTSLPDYNDGINFADLLKKYGRADLSSVHDILPSYI